MRYHVHLQGVRLEWLKKCQRKPAYFSPKSRRFLPVFPHLVSPRRATSKILGRCGPPSASPWSQFPCGCSRAFGRSRSREMKMGRTVCCIKGEVYTGAGGEMCSGSSPEIDCSQPPVNGKVDGGRKDCIKNKRRECTSKEHYEKTKQQDKSKSIM